ncbi:MAG: MBL fold metallo-hydrolase [Thermoguttaceae bacterium]|nr:MBL fold metallo-hydrolase [Thermoguttaceae bacterium]MDW8038101.1 MBL fold metallo-hydrolase [Thermoguttaceae bacterium]
MELRFLGANRQVTGSRTYVCVAGSKILIDCGMFQERDFLDRNWERMPVPAHRLEAVLLTHAHLDHCGLLPRLVEEGFRGPIYATSATCDLAEIVLQDSAEIQLEDTAYKRQRHHREGRHGPHPEIPLYTPAEVRRTVKHFRPVRYGEPISVAEGITAVFHDAGHILGSAMIELQLQEADRKERMIFTGDIGQWDKPILRDPTSFAEADYLVMEATYGNRDHPNLGPVEEQLRRVVSQTLARGGNVIIPAFAVERTQELLYYFQRLASEGLLDGAPVAVDSPMAVEVSEVYRRHQEDFDAEMQALSAGGRWPLDFPGLLQTRTREESKALNHLDRPAVIIATSGMCTAGRIKHHLAHNISRPECTILFTSYQAPGTLGRQILDGQPEVRIHGRFYPVLAQIEQIHGLSGHADRGALHRWLSSFQRAPKRVWLYHAEVPAAEAMLNYLRNDLGWEAELPEYGRTVVG